MPEPTTPVRVRFGTQGRLVVPAPMRKALGFKTADPVVVRVEDGRLVEEELIR